MNTSGQTAGVKTLTLESVGSDSVVKKTETLEVKVYDLVRGTALVSSVPVEKGKTASVSVEHLQPSMTITPSPTINLRQATASPLSWVSIANGASSSTITIDATSVAVAQAYTATLESYDASSQTRKTETLSIEVFDWAGNVSTSSRHIFVKSSSDFLLTKIAPSPATTYTHAIKMRQKTASTLAWVTLVDQATDT